MASRSRVAGIGLAAVLVVTLAAALYVIGSPARERARRLDERRTEELNRLAGAIDVYWTRHRRLPATVAEVSQDQGNAFAANDPATGVPYEYSTLAGTRFQLCATFSTDSQDSSVAFGAGFWSHHAGRQCFDREARTLP